MSQNKKETKKDDIKKTDDVNASAEAKAEVKTEEKAEEKAEEVPGYHPSTPTPVPEMVKEETEKKKKRVTTMYNGLSLKDYNSIITREAKEGEVDMFNNAIPAGKRVFCVKKADVPFAELKPMKVSYSPEDEQVVFKPAKIRNSAVGVVIAGERHFQYKQHTVVVEERKFVKGADDKDTDVLEEHGNGLAGYWNTALTDADKQFQADEIARKAQLLKDKQEAKDAKVKADAIAKAAAAAAKPEDKKSEEVPKETAKEKVNA